MSGLNYAYWEQLKLGSPEIKLLNRDSLPLVIGFLHQEFLQSHRHAIPQSELITALGNYLYDLEEQQGTTRYLQTPQDYLEDWASPDSRILRKYYPPHSQEAVFDLTPAIVRVMQFLESLETKAFIGAESRMKNLLSMLRNLAQDSETDPYVLIQEYKKQIIVKFCKYRLSYLKPFKS